MLKLTVFGVVALTAMSVIALDYMRLPNLLFGIGHYEVTLELPDSGGLYDRANVTYRGVEVGKVKDVRLTDQGVAATLSLKSGVDVPSDLDAEVHSRSAVGEQYVELLPRNSSSPPLKNGAVIPRSRSSVPPEISSVLDAANQALRAIPHDDLKTVIDESYTAVGGLGPELSRLVSGATTLTIDARKHLSELTNVVDNAAPVLDTQTDTSDSVQAFARHLATITTQLQDHDSDFTGILQNGADAFGQVGQLFDRLQPTLPILLANLSGIAPVLLTYQANLEQILVLVPFGVQLVQGGTLAAKGVKSPHRGIYLNFSLNLNLPPPCTTGFLPAQQIRPASEVDYPPRPEGDLYCRIPQDAMFNVRGARNIPCETRPGKRAPTVKMCESDENYLPLNEGFNWKGDPNATLSGQDIPQLAPGIPSKQEPSPIGPIPPGLAVVPYDPATGSYVGPDGQTYIQSDLVEDVPKEKTWETMLIPQVPK